MKKRILLATLIAATLPAFADDSGCFPGCGVVAPLETQPTVGLDLCRHEVVREAVKIEKDLRPVKELYDIATNPTGYAIKVVSKEVGIKIPRFVGYAMDPQGSLRNAAMKRVRAEVKKQVGLHNDCAIEAIEDDEAEGPFPTPEADSGNA